MCAVPSKVIFCSSLMLIWPRILPRYVSSPFWIAPSAPMITGIFSVLMPHIRFVSISKSLYLDSFSVTFTDVFLSDGTAMSTSLQVFVWWSLITISGLLAVIFLSVCIGMSHNILIFCNCFRFMVIPLFWCLYIIVVTDFPMYVRGCFIVSVNYGHLATRESRHQPTRHHKTTSPPANSPPSEVFSPPTTNKEIN